MSHKKAFNLIARAVAGAPVPDKQNAARASQRKCFEFIKKMEV
jgi:hypothetical protein